MPINGFSDTAAAFLQEIDFFPGTLSITPTAAVNAPAVLTAVPFANAGAGTYRVRVRMVSGTIVQDSVVSVTVEPALPARRRSVRR